MFNFKVLIVQDKRLDALRTRELQKKVMTFLLKQKNKFSEGLFVKNYECKLKFIKW